MSRFHSYLNSAEKLIEGYGGNEPFSIYARNFFKTDKKYGSTDRKMILRLCFGYFRLGKMLQHLPVREQILSGLFLCSSIPDTLTEALIPELSGFCSGEISAKLQRLPGDLTADKVFPYADELSEGVTTSEFGISMLEQPDVFLRIRPGKRDFVLDTLNKNGIEHVRIGESTVSVKSGFNINRYLVPDKDVVVQDYSSQRILGFLETAIADETSPVLWDCCAGSGGKSIMAYDINNSVKLTVSDIRESILANLKKRFEHAGIANYTALFTDLSTVKPAVPAEYFDIIIADVPCTGSGTWSRTPEQLYFFEEGKAGEYAALQKKIIGNVAPSLKPGGYLLYVTCSVFKKENEEVVHYIVQKYGLRCEKSGLLNGIEQNADTMFAALLRK